MYMMEEWVLHDGGMGVYMKEEWVLHDGGMGVYMKEEWVLHDGGMDVYVMEEWVCTWRNYVYMGSHGQVVASILASLLHATLNVYFHECDH